MSDVKEVLASIKKTVGMRDRIRKELGLKIDSRDMIDNDIYLFDYKRPELEHRQRLLLHGKCIAEGQKKLLKWGYEFLQVGHISANDPTKMGAMCGHCKGLLNEEGWKKHLKERKERLAKRRAEYLEEQEIRREWEAEQILLGKL